MMEKKLKCIECYWLGCIRSETSFASVPACLSAYRKFSGARVPKTCPRWCPLLKKGNKKEKAD